MTTLVKSASRCLPVLILAGVGALLLAVPARADKPNPFGQYGGLDPMPSPIGNGPLHGLQWPTSIDLGPDGVSWSAIGIGSLIALVVVLVMIFVGHRLVPAVRRRNYD